MKEINRNIDSNESWQHERILDYIDRSFQMALLVKEVGFFTNSFDDEFRVTRENGSIQGIFKTWAVPVIPFLETHTENALIDSIWDDSIILDSVPKNVKVAIENWEKKSSDQPLRLWQSLERWRNFSHVHDRRLQEVFDERDLPEDKASRVAELMMRMHLSFAFSSPFYNLEAMVADPHGTKLNPIETDSLKMGGGELDIVGMLLPSALSNLVVSSELDWHGLDWQVLDGLTKKASKNQRKIISLLSSKLGVEEKEIVFAANVLEWIPVSVGGKKDDVEILDAQEIILQKFRESSNEKTTTAVGRDFNGLIRFLNWFPLLQDHSNFSSGERWRYSAVCDTANMLMQEIDQGGVFTFEFEQVFQKHLSHQVQQLDATSAKGRFLLSLLNEGVFHDDVLKNMQNYAQDFIENVSEKLASLQHDEFVVNVFDAHPRAVVGGKAAGLREASLIESDLNILSGEAITTEAVETWLKSQKSLWDKVVLLDSLNDVDEKVALGLEIKSEIESIPFSSEITDLLSIDLSKLQTVRSSSFDEDTDFNGTAAGVYESEVGVFPDQINTAISRVIASFFSEKAISYRSLHGLSDQPMFAVLISELIEGRGGVGISDGKGGWVMHVAESPQNITDNANAGYDTYTFENGVLDFNAQHGWVNERSVDRIGKFLSKAEDLFGGRIDIEFIVDHCNEIHILQKRSLREKKNVQIENVVFEDLDEFFLNDISDFSSIDSYSGDSMISLRLSENINLDQFQGKLFRWLVKNRDLVAEIVLEYEVPTTGHFANICLGMGIRLRFDI